jgi:lipoyl(octanoyl) transferase
LNVNMDISPFNNIDPCGYQGLKVTNIVDHSDENIDFNNVANTLLKKFISSL